MSISEGDRLIAECERSETSGSDTAGAVLKGSKRIVDKGTWGAAHYRSLYPRY